MDFQHYFNLPNNLEVRIKLFLLNCSGNFTFEDNKYYIKDIFVQKKVQKKQYKKISYLLFKKNIVSKHLVYLKDLILMAF